jgi:hypothetical protein
MDLLLLYGIWIWTFRMKFCVVSEEKVFPFEKKIGTQCLIILLAHDLSNCKAHLSPSLWCPQPLTHMALVIKFGCSCLGRTAFVCSWNTRTSCRRPEKGFMRQSSSPIGSALDGSRWFCWATENLADEFQKTSFPWTPKRPSRKKVYILGSFPWTGTFSMHHPAAASRFSIIVQLTARSWYVGLTPRISYWREDPDICYWGFFLLILVFL